MVRLTGRFAAVALVAALAGLLRGVRVNLAPFLVEVVAVDATQVGLVVTLVGVVGLLVHPLGSGLAGYFWGRTVDVSTAYGSFLASALAATVLGFLVGYLAVFLPLLGELGGSFAVKLVSDLVFAVSLVSVALVAFAGAAVAQFTG